MRILFINEGTQGAGPLGHDSLDVEMRRRVDDLAVDASFCRLPPPGRLARIGIYSVPLLGEIDLDLQVVRWHAVQGLRARRLVGRELRSRPVDALHVNTHSISFGLLRLMRSIPTVLSVDAGVWGFRALGVWRRPWAYSRFMVGMSRALERRAFGRAALVTAWTEWARQQVIEACPEARVVVCHPGTDLTTWRPVPHRPRERPRVLFVGARFQKKGGADLLGALGPEIGRSLDLDIVTRDRVEPRRGLHLHRLSFRDPRLIDLYQQADLFCLPSHGDASPFALLEAMACGTPVVASAVGGIEHLVGGRDNAVLVPPGDRPALRTAVLDLLADPARRAELAQRSRAFTEAHYDETRQTARLLDLIGRAVRDGHQPE